MRPSVLALLTALDEAGPAGMPAGDLARLFDNPASIQRRLSWTGTELRRHQASGFVTRSRQKEPSAYYHNAPVYRWFITPAGSAYLDGGLRAGREALARAATARQEQEGTARELRQARLLREAAEIYGAGMCPCFRDAEIRHLDAEGCRRAATGAVYSISRERVRQIAAGLVTLSCEPGHDYAGRPCQHGIVTPASPEMARRRTRKPETAGRTA